MFQGMYTLSSSMITQNRQMDVISNNLANVSTPGYKSDSLVSGTFKDELLLRTSNNMSGAIGGSLGTLSLATIPYRTYTDFSGGSIDETDENLDFAIQGDGFFKIRGQNGDVYTRNGSFIIDNGGYLSLQGVGRVVGDNGPIHLTTDNFNVKSDGTITDKNGKEIAKLSVFTFDNLDTFTKVGENAFSTTAQSKKADANILWKYVETSNVDPTTEMTNMLASQREIQSAAQVLKMYDELMGKATTEIGRV
ncbi:MAG: flagellar hook-basal body protein [Clostridia bacterium]|jgi:flagellar basal-body rod protein FlgG|nr:flagellar hook-basal body protein [Clostridia bacterium]